MHRVFIALLLICVSALVGCGSAEIGEEEKSIRGYLQDPSSAEFRNVRVTKNGVCGEYNSKNSFGGFVGFRPFFWPRRKPENAVTLDGAGRIIQMRDPEAAMFQNVEFEQFYCETV